MILYDRTFNYNISVSIYKFRFSKQTVFGRLIKIQFQILFFRSALGDNIRNRLNIRFLVNKTNGL